MPMSMQGNCKLFLDAFDTDILVSVERINAEFSKTVKVRNWNAA